ncbi:hypothetical protein BP5796_13138 [Coleophoma crateriformis]|uniref:Uncharacterized protein n=1 Tax=Coleophoma crateriformis TaxID=565419 RepID=A0A3D8Q460_9HELO|nr:hypothetical protein BP5796_13138 [Coleophoma crateriformis]
MSGYYRTLLPNNVYDAVWLGIPAFFAYYSLLIIYRLYLSPLANIPGPKTAGMCGLIKNTKSSRSYVVAMTELYAFYHDVYRGGRYVWVVEQMHKRYGEPRVSLLELTKVLTSELVGPVVRIRPNTVHMNDAKFLDQVYGLPGKRRDKSKSQCNSMMTPGAFVATADHELHRRRRAPMSSFFSKQSVNRLEPFIQEALGKTFLRFQQHATAGTPIRLRILFTAATSDIIKYYSFGKSRNSLDAADLEEPFYDAMTSGKMVHVSSYIPWFTKIFTTLPSTVVIWLEPKMKHMLPFFMDLETRLKEISSSKQDESNPTIMPALINSTLPDSEKSPDRLFSEARVILFAGTDTTATAMSNIFYHLLSTPECLRKLKAELEGVMPNIHSTPDSSQLQRLPYLSAVIQETLRLHPPGAMRQERVAPDEDIILNTDSGKHFRIPAGTVMGMTAPLLAKDESLFPRPSEWRPERWIENPNIDKDLLTWSRSSRICLGMNLANAELYVFIAGIFRRYDLYDGTGKQTVPTLELYETKWEDICMVAEHATAYTRDGSYGVRVMVRE